MNYPYYPYQQQTGEPVYVQGEAGAKSFFVAPGKSAILMDAEQPRFFLKTVDASGMPHPLRTFRFEEETAKPDEVKYVTQEEFRKFVASLKEQAGEEARHE